MTDNYDFGLNNPNNLNPRPVQPPSENELEQQRAQRIENWNNRPEVKGTGIKAIDETKNKTLGNNKYYTLIVLSVIGFLVIALSCAVIGYTVYKDGTISPTLIVNNTCAPVMPAIPQCPAASACTNTCNPVILVNQSLCPACNPTLNCLNSS